MISYKKKKDVRQDIFPLRTFSIHLTARDANPNLCPLDDESNEHKIQQTKPRVPILYSRFFFFFKNRSAQNESTTFDFITELYVFVTPKATRPRRLEKRRNL